MEFVYCLPRIRKLHIRFYDLYKCPLDIEFSEKLNLIFGANGLGKTTLLNIIQYSLIGPYVGRVRSRNWKNQQKLKRPILDKNYFRNRMSKKDERAEVKVVYTLGEDEYVVCHSLYDYKLKSVSCNNCSILGDDISYEGYEKKYFGGTEENLARYLVDKYHRRIEKSSCFPDINSYILMITEMMFFSESRDFAFWEEDLCKSILSKFMPVDKYFEYDEVQKLVKKYDSQARLTSYKMSMVKDFLGDDFLEKSEEGSAFSLDDLQDINRKIDLNRARLDKIENEMKGNERQINQIRIERENVNRLLLDVEERWYDNIFPDEYQKMYNRFVPSILTSKCPFCGKMHLEKKLDVNKCFYCNKVLDIKKKADLHTLEIERKNLENESNRLANNYNLLQKEKTGINVKLREEEKELGCLIEKQQSIKKELDLKNNDNIAKYRKLELQKQELTNLLLEARSREQLLAQEIDDCISEVFRDYNKVFKKYAYSFLGNDKRIELELAGKADEAFFRFYLNGTERDSELALSESQRIFVDMAYRLATLEFFHKDSYFISETPDSTLDYLFEENAVNTFSYFIDSGNTIFMSANARNSKLTNSLVNRYKQNYCLINLLEISSLVEYPVENVKQLNIYDFLEDEQ